MNRSLVIAVISGAATLAITPLLSAIGGVAAHVSVPCMLVAAMVMRLRPADAFAAAIGSGIIADILFTSPFLMNTVLWVVIAAVSVVLGERVFSHLSMGSYVGLNTIGYLLYGIGTSAAGRISAYANGAHVPSITFSGAFTAVLGLVVHLGVAVVILLIARRLRAIASPFIVITRRAV
jgi:hypothetical protein